MVEQQILSSTVWTWNREDLIMLIGSNKINEGGNSSSLERALGSTESLFKKGEEIRLSLYQASK